MFFFTSTTLSKMLLNAMQFYKILQNLAKLYEIKEVTYCTNLYTLIKILCSHFSSKMPTNYTQLYTILQHYTQFYTTLRKKKKTSHNCLKLYKQNKPLHKKQTSQHSTNTRLYKSLPKLYNIVHNFTFFTKPYKPLPISTAPYKYLQNCTKLYRTLQNTIQLYKAS
jgi:hypothetical protein